MAAEHGICAASAAAISPLPRLPRWSDSARKRPFVQFAVSAFPICRGNGRLERVGRFHSPRRKLNHIEITHFDRGNAGALLSRFFIDHELTPGNDGVCRNGGRSAVSFGSILSALPLVAMPTVSQQAPAPANDTPSSLDLFCVGSGTLHTTQRVPDGRDKDGHARTRSVSVDEPFQGALRFRIRNNSAEALPPEPMLAQAQVGGWRQVKKLTVSEAKIDGKIDLGFLYAPVFQIDRYAGTISVSGSMNAFQGQCRPYDGSQRQF